MPIPIEAIMEPPKGKPVTGKRRGRPPLSKSKGQSAPRQVSEAMMPEPSKQVGPVPSDPFSCEHPLILAMAEEWDQLEAEIQALQAKKVFLEHLMDKSRVIELGRAS